MARPEGKTAMITGGTDKALELMGDAGIEAVGGATPVARLADADEIGAVAAFLASSDSSFMAGSEVLANGVFADAGIAPV